ncbi:protein ACCELERATED CELL DEATH 6-like [Carex rostrata]
MAIPSSQSMSSQSNELYRLLMPADLFIATIEGNRDVLIPRLELQPDEPTDHVQVPIEAPHSPPRQISTENLRNVQSELRSATRSGDTLLHLLVTRRHNELASMVFEKDMSLLKAKNKVLETPLHCAARAGNREVIQKLIDIDYVIVKDALEEINEQGDTAMHVATKHGHIDCGKRLLWLNHEILYKVNNEMLSAIHIAITKGYTEMVKYMLAVDPTLGRTQFPDEVFPVHLIALTGNANLVIHFMEMYPNHAELLDSRGRNIFHIAAEENHKIVFLEIFTKSFANKEKAGRMNNAVDYEGNTPMHIAAMKGHTSIVRVIWESKSQIDIFAERFPNNEGLTPFEVSLRQLGELSEHFDDAKISKYLRIEGHKFTAKWFVDVVGPPIADYWQKIQVIGLGSVLITTVTFAAAFTIPGGYNQDNGTPILGRKHIFRAFIIANSLAFLQGFLSLFALLGNAMEGPTRSALAFAIYEFILAASSMVVAFGLGMYVTLAPVSLPLAIIILVVTLLLASPALFYVVSIGQKWIQVVYNIGEYIMPKSRIGIMYVLCIGTILCLAYLL